MILIDQSEYQSNTKTEEELIKFTLEEGLNEVRRSFQILTKGQSQQKFSVYANLTSILSEPDGFERLFPIINEDLINQEEYIQIVAAQSLEKGIREKLFSRAQLIQIYNLTLNMLKIWSFQVTTEWGDIFKYLIQYLDNENLDDSIKKFILQLLELTQCKQIGGKLIGILYEVRKGKVDSILLDKAKQLCDDKDAEVKVMMIAQVMKTISSNVSTETIQFQIMDKAYQLCYDQDIKTKLLGIELLFEIVQYLPKDEQIDQISKIYLEFMNSTNEEVQAKMGFITGDIYGYLTAILSEQQFQQIFQLFQKFSASKNDNLRLSFAHAFAQILLHTKGQIYEKFKAQYEHMILNEANKTIRSVLLTDFAKIISFFNYRQVQSYFSEIHHQLVNTQDLEQAKIMVENMVATIQCFKFKTPQNLNPDSDDTEIHQIIELDQLNQAKVLRDYLSLFDFISKSKRWRLQQLFLENMSKCYHLFDIDQLYVEYITALQSQLASQIKPITKSCIKAIAEFLTINYQINHSDEIMTRMTNQYLNSESCIRRLIFIDFFEQGTKYFSRQFYKKYKLLQILNLAYDKIWIVRLHFVRCIPQIRYIIDDNDEEEEEEYLELEKIINKFSSSSDPEIKNAMAKACSAIQLINFDCDTTVKQILAQDQLRLAQEIENQQKFEQLQKIEPQEEENQQPLHYTQESQGKGLGMGKKKKFVKTSITPKIKPQSRDALSQYQQKTHNPAADPKTEKSSQNVSSQFLLLQQQQDKTKKKGSGEVSSQSKQEIQQQAVRKFSYNEKESKETAQKDHSKGQGKETSYDKDKLAQYQIQGQQCQPGSATNNKSSTTRKQTWPMKKLQQVDQLTKDQQNQNI